MRTCDVIIVGGSLGGVTTALRLAQKGVKVTLIEKHKIDKAKACGEGLSSKGVECLRQLGLGDALAAASVTLDSYAFFSSRSPHKYCKVALSNEWGIGINRQFFFTLLREKLASHPHLDLYEGQKRAVKRCDKGFSITTSHGEIVAPYVVIADGALSQNATALHVPEYRTRGGRVGISCHGILTSDHVGIADRRTVGVFMDRAFQCYVTPVGGGRVNLSALFDNGASGGGPGLLRLVEKRVSMHGVSFSPDDSLRGASHIGAVRRPLYFDGVFLVGDSVEQLDPVGGMGMTHALQSGSLVSHAILQLLEGRGRESVLNHLLSEYGREVRKLRGFTRLSQLITKCSASETLRFLLLRSPITAMVMHQAHQNSKEKEEEIVYPLVRSFIHLLGTV